MNSSRLVVKRPNSFAWALALLAGISLAAPAAAQTINNDVPKEVEQVTVEQKQGEQIPFDIGLIDIDGKTTRTGNYFDGRRPVLLTLNYSDCPVLCNVQLNALADSLDKLPLQLGKDFQILTVSIDPNEPTERSRATRDRYLAELQQQPAAAEGWHFFTASQGSIDRLAEAVGFRYTYDKQSGEYYHPAMLAFVSPQGVISQYSLDVAFPPEQLRLALLDAGSGSIGSPIDQFIMWCFSYDSSRGSYVLAAWRLMRLGAAATVGLLLFTLIPYWLGKKRAARLRNGGQSPGSGGQSPGSGTPQVVGGKPGLAGGNATIAGQ